MKTNMKRLTDMFNLILEQINPKYLRSPNKGEIGPCEMSFSQPETHLLYRDVERCRKKTASGQIKPVHFVDAANEVIKRFFMKNILR